MRISCTKFVCVMVCGAMVPLMTAPAHGQTQTAKLVASGKSTNDEFGWRTAVDGIFTIIGAPLEEVSGETGAAYIFQLTSAPTTWTEVAKLLGSGGDDDLLGFGVDNSGDLAIAGAPFSDSLSGAAYIFCRDVTELNQWGQEFALPSPVNNAYFGISVAIDEAAGWAAVGAPGIAPSEENSLQRVYVYQRDDDVCGADWAEEAMLEPGSDGEGFGLAVALSGNTLVVGAKYDDDAGSNAGAVFVFVYSGSWSQQAKLTASDAAAGDQFGQSVAIDGNTLIVGAVNLENGNGNAAYIFDRTSTTWSEIEILIASDAASDDQFGYTVDIDGDLAIVGARLDNNTGGTDAGAAYVFTRDFPNPDDWDETAKLTASDGAADDQFGSVAITGTRAVIGARFEDPNGTTNAGSAYVFEDVDD